MIQLWGWITEPYRYDEFRVLLVASVVVIAFSYVLLLPSQGRLKIVSPSILGTVAVHYGYWSLVLASSWYGATSHLLRMAGLSILFPGLLILLSAFIFNMIEVALKRRVLPELVMFLLALLGHAFAVRASFDPSEL